MVLSLCQFIKAHDVIVLEFDNKYNEGSIDVPAIKISVSEKETENKSSKCIY